jgi:putative tryptophan/tyrosine transport system substrate-binding protein
MSVELPLQTTGYPIGRRAVAAGLLLAAAARSAWAQTSAKQHRIAVITSVIPANLISETGGDSGSRLLLGELRRLGYVEGRNLVVERYSAEGHPERLPSVAREAVDHKPDLIVAIGGTVAHAVAAATITMPIVATFADPVGSGLVASLARPGSNITGVSVDTGIEIVGKRLQLLKEAVPSTSKAAYLDVSGSPEGAVAPVLAAASRRLAISLIMKPLRELTPPEYQRVFAEIAQQRVDAVLVSDGGEPLAYRQLIAQLALKNRLPTMCAALDYVEVGGLMAYAADPTAVFQRVADVIHQIFDGTPPGGIPITQPTKFELLINLHTAKALSLALSPTLLAAADGVIE